MKQETLNNARIDEWDEEGLYEDGLQWPTLFWLAFNDPSKISEPYESTQYAFDQGNQLGKLEKKLFPECINIPSNDFWENKSP